MDSTSMIFLVCIVATCAATFGIILWIPITAPAPKPFSIPLPPAPSAEFAKYYLPVVRPCLLDLTNAVNDRIESGYEPYGSLIIDGRWHIQVMMKKNKEMEMNNVL